jgi:hypothetical protein
MAIVNLENQTIKLADRSQHPAHYCDIERIAVLLDEGRLF